MDLALERVPTLVAGTGTFLLGTLVLGMSPRAPLHRAFALFCGLRGGMLALQAFSFPVQDLQGRMSVYFMLAIPFSAVWLAHVFLQPRRPSLRLAYGLLAATLAVESVYLADHGLYFGTAGPLRLFFALQFVSYTGVGLVVASVYRDCLPGPRRRALYPLALGLAAEPTYWAAFNAFRAVRAPATFGWINAAVLGVVVALALGIAWRLASRAITAEERLDRWRFLWVQAIAAATGVATFAALRAGLGGPLDIFFLLNAFWTLFLVAAVAYSIVRFRLFTIDLRVKTFLRHSATAIVSGTLFLVASELLEEMAVAAGMASLLAAIAIAAALHPLSRLTRRLSDRLMPGVADDSDYHARRRKEIYRAALQQALLDGKVTPREQLALDALWKSLGLSGREVRELEQEMQPA